MKPIKRLKELRKKENLTMEELGKKIGVSRTSISRYENGERSPTLDVLEDICAFFSVNIDYLTGQTDINDFEYTKVIIIPKGKYLGSKEEELIRKFAKDLEEYIKE